MVRGFLFYIYKHVSSGSQEDEAKHLSLVRQLLYNQLHNHTDMTDAFLLDIFLLGVISFNCSLGKVSIFSWEMFLWGAIFSWGEIFSWGPIFSWFHLWSRASWGFPLSSGMGPRPWGRRLTLWGGRAIRAGPAAAPPADILLLAKLASESEFPAGHSKCTQWNTCRNKETKWNGY